MLVLDDFLPYRLSFASNLVSERIARAYEAMFGLTIPEWRLVAVVAEAGPVAQTEIGQRTRMDKVTVSRAAIALVGRGLMERVAHAADRRSRPLVLTAAGRALHAAIAPKALEMERRLFADFSDAELRTLTAMLRRIDAAALAME